MTFPGVGDDIDDVGVSWLPPEFALRHLVLENHTGDFPDGVEDLSDGVEDWSVGEPDAVAYVVDSMLAGLDRVEGEQVGWARSVMWR
ncbi:hypothetical protein [Nocardia sp. NPDC058497]|uniref:hypothetical protein n=1 Tax=Nocardia sp. NPDC058497 TaxID=3346529 RepID=UPI0036617DFF